MTLQPDNRSLIIAGAVILGALWYYKRATSSNVDDSTIGGLDLSSFYDVGAEISNGIIGASYDLGINLSNLWTPPSSAQPYLNAIRAAEVKYGIPQNMLARLLYQESHFRPDIITGAVKSAAGALGIAQFMPSTAKGLGVDPLNPAQAIDGAGKYLSRLKNSTGNWLDALAAYNWGLGNVKKKGTANAPAETKNYFTSILSDLGWDFSA